MGLKKIYLNLLRVRIYRPASIIRYSEMSIYFQPLKNYKLLDPYLREFIYKLYHCKLIFKRYRLNLNDLLNNGQKCILCNNAIDTPKHLFEECEKGTLLRNKCENLIRTINHQNITLTEEQRVYNCFCKYNMSNR